MTHDASNPRTVLAIVTITARCAYSCSEVKVSGSSCAVL